MMARFGTHAEILTPDHPYMKMYTEGFRQAPPGTTFAELLQQTGGTYELMIDISPQTQEQIRKIAELTHDAELLAISRMTKYPVPFENLRGTDPSARVSVGYQINYEPGEAEALGLSQGPRDPRNSFNA